MAAGRRPSQRVFSDADLRRAVRAVARRVDGELTSTAYIHERLPGQEPTAGTLLRRHGPTWSQVLTWAGVANSRQPRRRWSDDEARDALARWVAENPRARIVDYHAARRSSPAALPPVFSLLRQFVTWRDAVAAARGGAGGGRHPTS